MQLKKEFFNRDATEVAKNLLGKVLINKVNSIITSGIIVETEAYMGINDKGSHTYNGKRTPKVEAMYGEGGTIYVYIIYGAYCCLNIVTGKEEIPQAVLIRALQPLDGMDTMALRRFKKPYNELSKKEILGLTNGPGKLCIAMSIDKSLNKKTLSKNELYIDDCLDNSFGIKESKRIGIDYAEEAKDFLWRYSIEKNPFVSK